MSEPVEVSAAVPCLNEAENVVAIAAAIAAEFDAAGATYEIIFIDNGSTDGTVDLIKGLCAKDSRIRLIVNNKNYGQMRSPTHAIYQACGQAVIGISSDFQDPTSMLGEFIARWRAGAKIVLGVRRSEDTAPWLLFIRALGYGFFERFGDYRVIPGATGFGLYDREVVDCLKQWRDPEPFFRGMLVESGFEIEQIPYDRPPRAAGETKNNFGTLISFFLSGLASSSKKLLRLPFVMALAVGLASPLFGVIWVLNLLIGNFAAGWLWSAIISALFAFVFFFLGLIGEQVRLISEMVRNVPLVIEKERINFPPTA
jgi:glycosyltransferase involved in cell wall biosynthesis